MPFRRSSGRSASGHAREPRGVVTLYGIDALDSRDGLVENRSIGQSKPRVILYGMQVVYTVAVSRLESDAGCQ